MKRYFLHLIDRKLFILKSPSFLLALVSLYYAWEFLTLHTKILSITAKEDSISYETLQQAIIDSEGHFTFHKLAGDNLYPPPIEEKTLLLLIHS